MAKTKFEAFLTKELPKNRFETALIISIVRDKKIMNIEQLSRYLKNETDFCKCWLMENKTETLGGLKRRICTQKLEQFNRINNFIETVLFGKKPMKRWKRADRSWVG